MDGLHKSYASADPALGRSSPARPARQVAWLILTQDPSWSTGPMLMPSRPLAMSAMPWPASVTGAAGWPGGCRLNGQAGIAGGPERVVPGNGAVHGGEAP